MIEKSSAALKYKLGMGYAVRAKGLYYEVKENYDSALHFYLQMEALGNSLNEPLVVLGALNSQFQIHFIQKQYTPAKAIALRAVDIAGKNNALKHLSANYSNLGIICRREKKYDSAFYYYKQSLTIKEKLNDSAGIANTNINISGLMLYTKQYDKVIEYVLPNIAYHKAHNQQSDLRYDYTNIAIAYGYKKNFAISVAYLDSALVIAQKNKSKEDEAAAYKAYGEVYSLQGNWQKAYEMMVKGNDMEADVINEQAGQQLLELQEKYKTKEKEQQNKLLAAEIDKQKLQQRNIWIGATALGLIAFISLIAWQQNRNKKIKLQQQNSLINEQNKKLTELNADKNQLISIVSHDLGQPLNNIGVWAAVLKKRHNDEAIQHIQNSVQFGQQLIHHILDIEKAGANAHALTLEPVGINAFLHDVINDFKPAAKGKHIKFEFWPYRTEIFLITDKQHLRQILENLISNALKFSNPVKTVFLAAEKTERGSIITIRDEGPGIHENELKHLFNKYSIASAKPTAGEASTGLGLSIVKRLMLELGGTIEVESETGKGTTFKLKFVA
ncbi:MAG TPA: tetratricopeptide repeat-containing sensor histidine kinase [Panacibacter sp.]|nr:tetratricopeptide repeat-containing sensor histidine kinase [Panacibacter sp.]